MKNHVRNAICFLIVSTLAFTGCLDLSQHATDADASIKKTLQEGPAEVQFSSCAYSNRAITESISKVDGVIVQLVAPDDPESSIYIIQRLDTQLRYVPCSLPISAQVNGAKITFSGDVVAIAPEERWVATPLNITNIFSIDRPDNAPVVNNSTL